MHSAQEAAVYGVEFRISAFLLVIEHGWQTRF